MQSYIRVVTFIYVPYHTHRVTTALRLVTMVACGHCLGFCRGSVALSGHQPPLNAATATLHQPPQSKLLWSLLTIHHLSFCACTVDSMCVQCYLSRVTQIVIPSCCLTMYGSVHGGMPNVVLINTLGINRH